jgi:AraC-like DNA-binding protein
MTPQNRRRITVVLLDRPQSRELLSLGATIAALLQAEIEGVFVEDDALFRLTGLPFLRELRLDSRHEVRLDPARLAQEWRAIAKQAREALEESATRAGLNWSFRVWRGEYDSDLKHLASDSEMLLMCSQGSLSSRRLSRQSRQDSTASAPLRLGVVLDAGMARQKLLEMITELGQKPEIALTLFLPDEEMPSGETPQSYLARHDPNRHIAVVYINDLEPATLARQLKQSACDLLMLSEQSTLLQGPTIKRILERLLYPTVVIRE